MEMILHTGCFDL